MEITAIPPTTPPAIAPEFELWPARTGVVGDIVEDVLELVVEELAAEEEVRATDALEGPRIAPGTSSGVSIKRSGVRTRSDEGSIRKGRMSSPPTEYDLLGFQRFSF
jgi:hypothetical protein